MATRVSVGILAPAFHGKVRKTGTIADQTYLVVHYQGLKLAPSKMTKNLCSWENVPWSDYLIHDLT